MKKKKEKEGKKESVRNWILTSCQPHWVTFGREKEERQEEEYDEEGEGGRGGGEEKRRRRREAGVKEGEGEEKRR